MPDLSPARLAILQASASLVGMTAPGPAYARIIAPAEVDAGMDARVAEMVRESGCGLVTIGLWRLVLSLPAPTLYRDGKAFEDIYALADGSPWHPSGACSLVTRETLPQPGDAILWEGVKGGAPDHVDACVLSITGGPGPLTYLRICVIAGGQRIDRKDVDEGRATEDQIGHETVKEIERLVRWDGHAWRDAGNGRRMWCVFDCDAMAERHGLLADVL